jgi:hypothetical protein
MNPDCELNNEKKNENNWTLAEHKDNQAWAVRHLRMAEATILTLSLDNEALKLQIVGLMQQNVDLATRFQYLVDKLEMLYKTDMDGDGSVHTTN